MSPFDLFILSILLKIFYVDSRLVALQLQLKFYQNERNRVIENGTLRCCDHNDKEDLCKSPCQPWIDVKIMDKQKIMFEKKITDLPQRPAFIMDNEFTRYNILVHNWTEKSVMEIKVYNSGDVRRIIINNVNISISDPAASESRAKLNVKTFLNSRFESRLEITWKVYNKPDFYLISAKDGHCDTNGNRVCSENYYGFDCSVYCVSSPSESCVIKKKIHKRSTFVNLYIEVNALFIPGDCIDGFKVSCFLEIRYRNKTLIKIRDIIPTGSLGSFGAIFPNWTHSSDILLVIRTFTKDFGQLLITDNSTIPDEDVRNAEMHSGVIDSGFNMSVRWWIYYSKVFPGGCHESDAYFCSTNGSKLCKFGRFGSDCDHICPDHQWSDRGSCNTNIGWLCNKGWKGENCSEDVQECDSAVCENNSTCIETPGSYTCTCLSGWTGKNCTTDINECKDKETCHNGGTCTNTGGSYHCVCTEGWEGSDCSKDVDECEKRICKNGGTCLNVEGGFNCTCQKGFEGDECENDINECLFDICFNNGSCFNFNGGYNCTCNAGWSGVNCESDINECQHNICHNNGTCINHQGNFTCLCSAGWVGNKCNIDINECQKDMCVYGNCSNTEGSYTCTCDTGWAGSDCQTDINECESNPCVSGICINVNGSFLCENDGNFTSTQSGEFILLFTTNGIAQTSPKTVSTSKPQALATVLSLYPTKTDFPTTEYIYASYNSMDIVTSMPKTDYLYSAALSSTTLKSEINPKYLTSYINFIQPSNPVKIEPMPSSYYLQKTPTVPISTTMGKLTMPVSIENSHSPAGKAYMKTLRSGLENYTKALLPSTKSLNSDLRTETVTDLSIDTTQNVNNIAKENAVYTSSQGLRNFKIPTRKSTVKYVRHENDVTTPESSTVKIDEGIKKEASSKGWFKDNLLLVLGVSIGISVVLVVVVIVLVCKRRRHFSKQRQGPHSDLLANKNIALLLEPRDELEEKQITKINPMYDILHGKQSQEHQTSV